MIRRLYLDFLSWMLRMLDERTDVLKPEEKRQLEHWHKIVDKKRDSK